MSEFFTKKISDRAGTGAPNFTYGLNIGGSDSGFIGKGYTSSGSQPSSPADGDTWYDSTNDKYYIYANGEFKQITHTNAVSFTWGGSRALAMGGAGGSGNLNQIQYWDMTSASDAADFGDLQSSKTEGTGLSNGTRGICARGRDSARTNEIDYVTISTLGNAANFGNCTASRQNSGNGACDGTTGLLGGTDTDAGGYGNEIERITVATTSNASDHGDLTTARIYVPLANDATRYLAMGGYQTSPSPYYVNTIEYGTFTAGNSADFGDLINPAYGGGVASDEVRALKAGGAAGSGVDQIEYVTIQSLGGGTDFGDLIQANQAMCGVSDGTRAQFFGNWSSRKNIHSVVIQTAANATDHGDLVTAAANMGGCSGAAS